MDFELLVSEIEQACKDHGVTVLRAVPFHISHVPTFRVEDEVSPSKVIRAAKATTPIVYLDVLRLTRKDLEEAAEREPGKLDPLKNEIGKICAISLYLPSQSGFLTEWHKFAPWYFSVFEERYVREAEDDEDEGPSAREEELAARAARLLAMGKTKKMVAKLLGITLQDLERLI